MSTIMIITSGQNSWWGARLLISLVEFQSRNILRMAAFQEIFLLPFSVMMIFAGMYSTVNSGTLEKVSVLTTFAQSQLVLVSTTSKFSVSTLTLKFSVSVSFWDFVIKVSVSKLQPWANYCLVQQLPTIQSGPPCDHLCDPLVSVAL